MNIIFWFGSAKAECYVRCERAFILELTSILIPAYKPNYFRACLTSALSQTWENKEIIVSDDCPTNEIEQICSQFSGHVSYTRNPEPGEQGRRNVKNLCRKARGTYLKFLFDDDVLHPFCVQYLVEALEATKDHSTNLAFSPRKTINEANHEIQLINYWGANPSIIFGADIIRKMASTLINPIGELTTVLFRKEDVFSKSGDLTILDVDGQSWRGLGDVALFTDLCSRGNAVFIPQVLSYFRLHALSNSKANQNPEWQYAMTDWKRMLDYAIRHDYIANEELIAAYQNLFQTFEGFEAGYPEHRTAIREQLKIAFAEFELLKRLNEK